MARAATKPRKANTAPGAPSAPAATSLALKAVDRPMAPIVPPGSIAGRALVAIIAIMCFLACLAVGAVALVTEAARDWQSEVMREMTIQVRPLDGVDTDREVARASDLARRTRGIAHVRVLSRAENERLLGPWLGTDLALDALPVPRLIVLGVDRATPPDIDALRAALARDVRSASLDDHRPWRERLAAMTTAVVAIGSGILVLVLAATALSVVFATRGAMAANREIVDVLHLVGAENRFIAGTFQRRFLRLGLEGGLVGGVAAIVAFHLAGAFARSVSGSIGERQIDLLFGALAFGWTGYLGILATVLAVAAVTALTSRIAVSRFLRSPE